MEIFAFFPFEDAQAERERNVALRAKSICFTFFCVFAFSMAIEVNSKASPAM